MTASGHGSPCPLLRAQPISRRFDPSSHHLLQFVHRHSGGGHRLKDLDGNQSNQGKNPFETITMKRDKAKLSSIVKAYRPPFTDSKKVYAYIKDNLAEWIEEAISIRENY